MKRKNLKVAFVDNCASKHILEALQQEYDTVIDEKSPDIVFYGNFGLKHLKYHCVKVFVNQECVAPDFNECDYAISSSKMEFDGRNLYMPPAFLLHLEDSGQASSAPLSHDLAQRPFCSFLYSQRKHGIGSQIRATFCETLMKYKKVDCPGKVLHNMDAPELSRRFAGDWNASKIRFISKYKFNIAFENSNSKGYITEKLTDALLAHTVPIYWGSEGDLGDFPKEALIYANDYPDINDLIARIKEVDQNDDEYMKILEANPFRHGFSLSRRKEFTDFILKTANLSKRPESCDPVDFSDMALLRAACGSRLIMGMILIRLSFRYFFQTIRMKRLQGKEHDSLLIASTRTKRNAHMLVNTLFPRRH